LLGLTSSLFTDDRYVDVAGYGLPVLLLFFGWVPIVGEYRTGASGATEQASTTTETQSGPRLV
jgi:hypothetical protein